MFQTKKNDHITGGEKGHLCSTKSQERERVTFDAVASSSSSNSWIDLSTATKVHIK